jgi:negative regulator of sigma E activity
MKDDRLRDLLRQLPRDEASSDFTDHVMRRLDEPGRRRPTGRAMTRLALASAVLAAAALVVGIAVRHDAPLPQSPDTGQATAAAGNDAQRKARLRELRREHDALMRELQAIREESRSSSPLLYLGGTDQLDVVVDLGRVGRTRTDDTSLAQPASHQTRP